ncbi:MAG: alpha/beta fold hydrolase, partial [Polyangiales bacterium]
MSKLFRPLTLTASCALVVVHLGCSSDDPPRPAAEDSGALPDEGAADVSNDGATIDGGSDVATDGGLVSARPYDAKVPSGYDKTKPTPLVILLHGYGASGAIQEGYFKLGAVADEKTFLLATPDGTLDGSGKRFWDASDACCNFTKTKVDDVAYVAAIIDDMSAKYNVDPKRVYLVGHSNGGFMSHRAACELSPRIAAIVSLAGAQWKNAAKCAPTSPVSIL